VDGFVPSMSWKCPQWASSHEPGAKNQLVWYGEIFIPLLALLSAPHFGWHYCNSAEYAPLELDIV